MTRKLYPTRQANGRLYQRRAVGRFLNPNGYPYQPHDRETLGYLCVGTQAVIVKERVYGHGGRLCWRWALYVHVGYASAYPKLRAHYRTFKEAAAANGRPRGKFAGPH